MATKSIKVKIIKKAGDKTVVGEFEYLKQHPIYKKYIRVFKKYMIHDETNTVKVGDVVSIKSCRPISKRKTWIIVNELEGKL